MLDDSLAFSWTSAMDVEGDSVYYHFELSDSLALLAIEDLADTVVSLRFDSLASWIFDIGAVFATGTWNLAATDRQDTNWVQDGPFALTIDLSTLDIRDLFGIPKEFALHQNYPNPFNPTTILRFDLPIATNVQLDIYDILGRKISRLASEQMEPGYHSIIWSGRDRSGRQIPSGIYIARLVAGEYTRSIKMLLLK
jgi:hypothetical protein